MRYRYYGGRVHNIDRHIMHKIYNMNCKNNKYKNYNTNINNNNTNNNNNDIKDNDGLGLISGLIGVFVIIILFFL